MTERAKRESAYALEAASAPPRDAPSNYPEPFASRMAGRTKRPLGDAFGLRNFGVNLTVLAPGAVSALHHRHSRQDELVYVLGGGPTLFTEAGEEVLGPGMCAGFPAGGTAHHLANLTDEDVVLLEIGGRSGGDAVDYPDDDIRAETGPDGRRRFTTKGGDPYP